MAARNELLGCKLGLGHHLHRSADHCGGSTEVFFFIWSQYLRHCMGDHSHCIGDGGLITMGQAPCKNNPPTITLPASVSIMKEFVERKETTKDFKKLIYTEGTSYNESIHISSTSIETRQHHTSTMTSTIACGAFQFRDLITVSPCLFRV